MDNLEGTPYREMSALRRAYFIFKVIVCVVTFGMVYPNVMSD